MNEKDKNTIIKALTNKLSKLECPMCHRSQFTLLEGCFVNVVQDSLPKVKLDGKFIPTVVLLCNNCGYLSQHAAGVLGVMDIISPKDNAQ